MCIALYKLVFPSIISSNSLSFVLFIHQVQVRGKNSVIKEGNEQPGEVFDQDFHLVRG